MGLIFAKLWSFFCNQEHKVIIVGLDNAGKTTILYQFLMNEVVHTSPTIGSNVEEIVVKKTHFLMWDIGGQESLRSSWNTYYSNTEFIILVVDSTDRERLAISKEELYKMLAHEDLRKAAVLIFANKQDMKGCMSAAEISKYLTLSSIKDHPWHIQSCCALTGEGEIRKEDASAADIIPLLETLKSLLSKEADSDHGVKTMKKALLEAVQKQFRNTTSNHMCCIATVLDLRCKDKFFDADTNR
uniref:ADP-ribosylation factor-like 8 n=3 Tax=Cyprinus carpio TaxID=7962 RepID=A0A8C1E953_CYPCA